MNDVVIVGSIGLLLSLYAFYLKLQLNKNAQYKAVCDVSSYVSCTKALKTSYGSLAILPNSAYGIVFYSVIIVLSLLERSDLVFYLGSFALLGSLYLAYVSFYKVKVFCPLCVGIWIVNLFLVLLSA